MDSIWNVSTQQNFRMKKSNPIGYGLIHDELHRPSYFFRGHSLLTVIYLLNRVSSKIISTIPYEIWHDKKSSLSHLKIWGCSIYIKWQQMDKLGTRSLKAHFIGYPKELLGYYFYISKDHNVIVSRNAIFFEK